MQEKINIIIPMAGAGSRFQVAGYDKPKPFIPFNGKMMIEHVLDSFSDIDANIYLVIQEKFLYDQNKELNSIKSKYNLNFVVVPKLTMGAACTCMAAHKFINNDTRVLFADSDTIFDNGIIKKFLQDASNRDLDASLLTFKSSNPCFSYAKLSTNGYLIKTREKEPISDNAISGVYYYKKGVDFLSAAMDLVVAQDTQKGEFYMSNTYNYFVKYSYKIGIYTISQDDFYCVGTPEQLNDFINKSNSNSYIKTP